MHSSIGAVLCPCNPDAPSAAQAWLQSPQPQLCQPRPVPHPHLHTGILRCAYRTSPAGMPERLPPHPAPPHLQARPTPPHLQAHPGLHCQLLQVGHGPHIQDLRLPQVLGRQHAARVLQGTEEGTCCAARCVSHKLFESGVVVDIAGSCRGLDGSMLLGSCRHKDEKAARSTLPRPGAPSFPQP